MRKRKPNPRDATLRNVRASKKRDVKLRRDVEKLKEQVEYLSICIENIEDSLAQIDLQFRQPRRKK